MDTRPEDLIVTPVIAEGGKIRYMASSVVSAMIKGGIAIIDEGNRMSEKSWASLAPLLDSRRYVESIVAGIKIKAHPDFRLCTTMNDDASTFELPDYIHSRLQPQIFIDFPDREEEFLILKANLPFADDEILEYVVDFLQASHEANERYSVRDGINVARYALKEAFQKRRRHIKGGGHRTMKESSTMILDSAAAEYFEDLPEEDDDMTNDKIQWRNVRFVPILHNRMEFAIEVRRQYEEFKPDRVAVEYPATLAEKISARC